jgi:DNA gyrase subunit B
VDGKDHFIHNDNELSKLTGDAKIEEKAEILELFESQEIEKIINKLAKLGLDIETYSEPTPAESTPNKTDKKPKFLYRLVGEKERQEFSSLKAVLDFVKAQAQKGMTIQRYKGLGEMNPQQLWDTTMDPKKRTLLKVALEDAVEAEKTFTILMGDQVEPRREFIENYAHKVKNLDI